mmetsp:Transcript_6410/g.17111  ORF Transcript_6410/g.17111 Transcript_6410/m.17111 type:complete len:987 (-) Transcript_6410:724-3684(-)
MSRKFTEHHVRPGVFYFSPKAHNERHEVKLRREEAQNYYKQAKALDTGTPEAAEQAEHLLSLAVAAWPQNAKFLLALANCICFKRKDPERALYWYDHLVDAADCPAHRIARAHALACLAWLDNALSDIQSALAGEPENGVYLQLRGIVQERMGDFYEAAMDFTAALPLLKASGCALSECIFNRGYCHRLMGNHAEALRDLEDAQHKAPASNAIKMTLASMYMAKKRYDDALPLFQAVAASQRSSAAAINNVALVYYMKATKEDDVDALAARRPPPALKVADKPATSKAQPQQQGSKSTHPSPEGPAPTQQGPDHADRSKMSEEQRRQARKEEDAAIMNEALSDDDEDDNLDMLKARSMTVGYKKGTANEDPKQWALSVVNSGASHFSLDPAHLGWLRTSLELFNKAMALYLNDAERTFACLPSNQDTHAIHEEEAADAWSGYLLILTNQVRVPGSAAIHDRELEDGELHYNRGLAYLALGMLLEAEEDFAEALRTAPSHAHYPHYRAVVHGRKGEFKEAVKWNLSALALNPHYFPALYHLGLCLYLQGRNAESIAQLDLALAMQPRSSEVMEARGRVLQELDRHTEALMSLQDALWHLSPEESSDRIVRLHFSMAQSAIITHSSEMLRTSLSQAKLHGQDPASVYGLRGLLAHREGRLHHARVCLSRAVFLAPEEARFLFDRSQLMLDLQEWEACLDDLRGAMELLPDCASLYYTCAMILYAKGNMLQAQENFEKAVEMVLAQEQKRKLGGARLVNATLALASNSHLSQMARSSQGGTGGTESKERWMRMGQAASLGDLKKVMASGDGAECTLRPDPRLWEGTKFITGAASPPDLTASLWYHLGCARASTHSYEGAAAALEQAHAYLPGHPAIMHELAKAYLAMGCVEAAEPLLTGVLSIQPGNAWALFRRALCHMAAKDYDRAADDLSSAKAMLPDEPVLAVDVKLIRAKWSEMVRQHLGPGPGSEAFVWDLAQWPPALQKSLPR